MRVKLSSANIGVLMLVSIVMLASAGCSKLQLARFAPPGIIKYEDIASEKPLNPEIEQMLAERRENTKAEFPILSETPGTADRPSKPGARRLEEREATLAEARDALNANVESDRIEAENDRPSIDGIIKSQQDLANQIAEDTQEAALERRTPIEVDQE